MSNKRLPRRTPKEVVEWVKDIEQYCAVPNLYELPYEASLEEIRQVYEDDLEMARGIGVSIALLTDNSLWPEEE